jgi:hypothetical protein
MAACGLHVTCDLNLGCGRGPDLGVREVSEHVFVDLFPFSFATTVLVSPSIDPLIL